MRFMHTQTHTHSIILFGIERVCGIVRGKFIFVVTLVFKLNVVLI